MSQNNDVIKIIYEPTVNFLIVGVTLPNYSDSGLTAEFAVKAFWSPR